MANGRSLLFDDNPESSKRSIKWNQYLTLSISLLIESDVSGFRANVSLPISLAFLGSVCLWSPSGLSMWKIYLGYTKEHNPTDFDHPSVITQMIGLQTMAHTCALWGGHSGELGLHPLGSLLVKSQYFMIFLKPTSHKDWGHTKCQSVMTEHHVDMKADVDYHETLYVLPTSGERTDVMRSSRYGQAWRHTSKAIVMNRGQRKRAC